MEKPDKQYLSQATKVTTEVIRHVDSRYVICDVNGNLYLRSSSSKTRTRINHEKKHETTPNWEAFPSLTNYDNQEDPQGTWPLRVRWHPREAPWTEKGH